MTETASLKGVLYRMCVCVYVFNNPCLIKIIGDFKMEMERPVFVRMNFYQSRGQIRAALEPERDRAAEITTTALCSY